MRQRVQSARFTPSTFVVALATLCVVGALVAFAVRVSNEGALDGADVLVSFGLAVAVGECLRVQIAPGRDVAPIGMAAALAFALLPEATSGRATGYGGATVIVLVAVGTLLGIAPHLLTDRALDRDGIAHRLVSVSVIAVLFREVPFGDVPLVERVQLWDVHRWRVAAVMVVAVGLTMLLDACLGAIIRASREHSPLTPVVRDDLRDLAGLGSAIGSTGILIALAARPMGLLAVPVFLAPLLLTQFAFRRYATVRATYHQTVRALSRVTEIGGYTETGHSLRVAELAQAMGRQLGFGERELRDLEYAALLHDIGQLSLTEAIPGGATVMAAAGEQRRIAGLGAEVVRQAKVLDTVATIVEQQAEPYRRAQEAPLGDEVDGVPMASRIIRVANAYDDLVGDVPGRVRRQQALERLQLGVAYDYDPRVVAALRRVVERFEAELPDRV
ncbi:MAG TPA: HD domain-containing phosphohydrolase [Actinomycetales bacterium]|nr:HD domain-containing phosphohydrolase [Actinomycetales bacterium]